MVIYPVTESLYTVPAGSVYAAAILYDVVQELGGTVAGEAFLEAREKQDFSRQGLASYRRRLDDSWVMKDLAHYRDAVHFLRTNREFVDDYQRLTVELIRDYFTIDDTPKVEVRKRLIRKVRDEVAFLRLARQMWRARKALV